MDARIQSALTRHAMLRTRAQSEKKLYEMFASFINHKLRNHPNLYYFIEVFECASERARALAAHNLHF